MGEENIRHLSLRMDTFALVWLETYTARRLGKIQACLHKTFAELFHSRIE